MSQASEGVTLRLAGEGDDALIRTLLAEAYPANPKTDAATMRWQYWNNPFGETRSWIWERDGEAIAHWAAVPVPLLLDGQAVVGVKTADAATHPAHRRQGLFHTLALRYMQDLSERGVPAVLTHPNPQSAQGVEASGAVLVQRVGVYVRALDDAWLAQRFRLPRPAARLLRSAAFPGRAGGGGSEIAGPPSDLDGLWAALGERWTVRRDAAWWQWRYIERPGGAYRFAEVRRAGQLVAAGVARVQDNFGGRFVSVLELLASDDDAAAALLTTVGEIGRAHGAVGAALIATSPSRAASQAKAAGFRKLPRRLEPNPLRFMVAAPGGDSIGLARKPWSVAWGDLDHL